MNFLLTQDGQNLDSNLCDHLFEKREIWQNLMSIVEHVFFAKMQMYKVLDFSYVSLFLKCYSPVVVKVYHHHQQQFLGEHILCNTIIFYGLLLKLHAAS
jgi:hypothetical protein